MTYLTNENRLLLIETISNICRRLGDAASEVFRLEVLEQLPDPELEQALNKILMAER